MRKMIVFLMGFGLMLGCSREYVQETIRIYDKDGITFDFRVRPKGGFIYTVGPFIDFIASNNAEGLQLNLLDVILKIYDYEKVIGGGDYYINNTFHATVHLPIIISNHCRWEGVGLIPDPSTYESGKIPASVQVKYQMDGVDMEINQNFEITVK